jgi:hypothetical protein
VLRDAVRAFLAKQPRCLGVIRTPHVEEYGMSIADEPPGSPCCHVDSDKIATHHEPFTDYPSVCDECAAWELEQGGELPECFPRRDLAELRALIAAVETT